MTRTRAYVHDEVANAGIDTTGELLALFTADRDRLTVSIEASAASDFALEVDFGDGTFVEYKTYSATDSVAETIDLAVESVRVRNTTAQTSGDTATVRLGAA